MIRCPDHDYHLKPDGCPMCQALKAEAELESLRQENSRLREALKLERDRWEYMSNNMDFVVDMMLEPWKESIADIDKALNPPKRS